MKKQDLQANIKNPTDNPAVPDCSDIIENCDILVIPKANSSKSNRGYAFIALTMVLIIALSCVFILHNYHADSDTVNSFLTSGKIDKSARDLTVKIDNPTVLNGDVSNAVPDMVCAAYDRFCIGDFLDNIDGLVKLDIPYLVFGVIKDIQYFDIVENGSTATHTHMIFEITESFRGDFNSGDKISIFQWGGYTTVGAISKLRGFDMGIEQDNDTIIDMNYTGMPQFKIGEEYLLFLIDATESCYSEGSYKICGTSGAYKLIDNKFFHLQPIWDTGESYYKNPGNEKNGIKKDEFLESVKTKAEEADEKYGTERFEQYKEALQKQREYINDRY